MRNFPLMSKRALIMTRCRGAFMAESDTFRKCPWSYYGHGFRAFFPHYIMQMLMWIIYLTMWANKSMCSNIKLRIWRTKIVIIEGAVKIYTPCFWTYKLSSLCWKNGDNDERRLHWKDSKKAQERWRGRSKGGNKSRSELMRNRERKQ